MSKNSYAEDIKKVEVMLSGLELNAEQVATRGLDSEFVQEFSGDLRNAVKLNNEQENLKSELKLKTIALEAQMLVLKEKLRLARTVVKVDFPQAKWTSFGIEDKR
jgi:hypothetical protein